MGLGLVREPRVHSVYLGWDVVGCERCQMIVSVDSCIAAGQNERVIVDCCWVGLLHSVVCIQVLLATLHWVEFNVTERCLYLDVDVDTIWHLMFFVSCVELVCWAALLSQITWRSWLLGWSCGSSSYIWLSRQSQWEKRRQSQLMMSLCFLRTPAELAVKGSASKTRQLFWIFFCKFWSDKVHALFTGGSETWSLELLG